jgi:hypothetical protein
MIAQLNATREAESFSMPVATVASKAGVGADEVTSKRLWTLVVRNFEFENVARAVRTKLLRQGLPSPTM